MLDYGWLNVGSLFLGLIAWGLPLTAMFIGKNTRMKNRVGYLFASFSACSVSLLFQLIYCGHLVAIRDWTALEDTQGATVVIALVLIIVTMGLNLWMIVKEKEK